MRKIDKLDKKNCLYNLLPQLHSNIVVFNTLIIWHVTSIKGVYDSKHPFTHCLVQIIRLVLD